MTATKKKPTKKAKPAPKKAGRPSLYTPALAAEICARLSKGEPLTVICSDSNMPHHNTVREWAKAHEAFSGDIAHARELGFDAIAAGTLVIADDGSNDWMKSNKPDDQGYTYNGEHVQRSKLRIETRLKLLAKWDPKRYGDKQQVEHTGSLTLEQLVTGSFAKPDESSG